MLRALRVFSQSSNAAITCLRVILEFPVLENFGEASHCLRCMYVTMRIGGVDSIPKTFSDFLKSCSDQWPRVFDCRAGDSSGQSELLPDGLCYALCPLR